MTEDTKYNGWTNYETWCAALWIDNEPAWYEQAREIAQNEIRDGGLSTYNEHKSMPNSARFLPGSTTVGGNLQAMIEEYIECIDENEVLSSGFIADMFNAAMSEIDWREIGEHYISDELDEVLKELEEELHEKSEEV